MKRINIFSLVLGVVLITSLSCQDFLDVKPTGKLIPETADDFEGMLNNVSTFDGHFAISNNCPLMALGDNVTMTDNPVKGLYTSTHSQIGMLAAYSLYYPILNPESTDGIYTRAYSSIAIFNSIIDGMKDLGLDKTPKEKEILAQARGGRAWMYLHLGLSYGKCYNPKGDNSSLTISYRTDAGPSVSNPPLATVSELFEGVEKDYLYAVEFAPEQVARPIRVSRPVVKALLAEMYMFKGDFEKMYKYSSEAWNELKTQKGGESGLLYNYNDLSYIPQTPAPTMQPGEEVEYMLSLGSPDNLIAFSNHKENLFYRASPTLFSPFQLTPEYLSLFKPGDKRDELFILKYRGYRGTNNGVTYDDKVIETPVVQTKTKRTIGMSAPMVLLMVAESAARTNRAPEALSALRTLRSFRYTPETASIGDLSGDALIAEVLDERRREQTITTPDRYWDLRRLTYETGKPWSKQKVTRVLVGISETKEIDSGEYQLSIANLYIRFNPQWGLPEISVPYGPYTKFEQTNK